MRQVPNKLCSLAVDDVDIVFWKLRFVLVVMLHLFFSYVA